MKIPFLIPLLLIFSVAGYAQIPQAFNYQAVIRDTNGLIQKDMNADFQIDILLNGSLVYSEEHKNENTGSIGVVNFKIGTGDTLSGDFSNINWADGQHELVVRLDGQEIGTSEIVAVPFALYAQKSGNNYWGKKDNDIFYQNGLVGIGLSNPQTKLHVKDPSWTDLLVETTGTTQDASIYLQNPKRAWRLHGDQSDNDKFKIAQLNAYGEPFSLQNAFVIESNGEVGIGVEDPLNSFHVKDNDWTDIIFETTGNAHDASIYLKNPNRTWRIHGDRSDGDKFKISQLDDYGGTTILFDALTIDEDGVTGVQCLEIKGGCDIKEDLNSNENLEPGDVVVIDENNPGQITRTNQEYDKKVAGVISGANGINPGLSLSQSDVLEGEYPLAMLGRVHVKVTGEVEIGNMLTTSSKPGIAMAVKDSSKAHGAVIGKAMTKNDSGEGMVLVLINLQ